MSLFLFLNETVTACGSNELLQTTLVWSHSVSPQVDYSWCKSPASDSAPTEKVIKQKPGRTHKSQRMPELNENPFVFVHFNAYKYLAIHLSIYLSLSVHPSVRLSIITYFLCLFLPFWQLHRCFIFCQNLKKSLDNERFWFEVTVCPPPPLPLVWRCAICLTCTCITQKLITAAS